MKNLLFVLAFVLISLTGFSQTFSYSTSQQGNTQQVNNLTVIHGGYNYSYSISSSAIPHYGSNITAIGSPHCGSIGVCSVNENFYNSTSGSGNSGAANPSFTSDVIVIAILNNGSGSSGSASITITCY